MTRSKLAIIIPFVLMAMIVGCSEDEILQCRQQQNKQVVATKTRSLEDALEIADSWFSQIDSINGCTRSDKHRRISSLTIISGNERTRTSKADTLLYLINYVNGQGFALLGGTTTSEGIYAISPDGTLDLNDTVFNQGLKAFIENAELHAASRPDLGDIQFKYRYLIKRMGDSLLPENVSKWNQTSPFNKYSYTSDGRQGVVGCGPVAVGMLMAHYRWPSSIKGNPVDWNAIIDNNNYEKIAQLLETVAGKDFLAAYYTLDSSGKENSRARATPINNFNSAFGKLGYGLQYSWNFYPFHDNRMEVFDFLQKGITNTLSKAPLIFYGNEPKGAHVWIVDGFMEMYKTVINSSPFDPLTFESDHLLHIVWGWGGKGNGYYYYFLNDRKINNSNTSGETINYTFGNLNVFGRYSITR